MRVDFIDNDSDSYTSDDNTLDSNADGANNYAHNGIHASRLSLLLPQRHSLSSSSSSSIGQHFRPRHTHAHTHAHTQSFTATTAASTSASATAVPAGGGATCQQSSHSKPLQSWLLCSFLLVPVQYIFRMYIYAGGGACWQWLRSFYYTTSNGNETRRTKKTKHSSSFFSDRMKTMISLLYIGVIAIVLLVSALMSFLWMPEFHTTSLSCDHHNRAAIFTSRHHFSSTFQDSMHQQGTSLHNKNASTPTTTTNTADKDKNNGQYYEHLFVQSKNTGEFCWWYIFEDYVCV